MKALEEENARLVDQNSAMEDDFKKSTTLRTLADSYKSQIAELESRGRAQLKELTGALQLVAKVNLATLLTALMRPGADLRFKLEQTQDSLHQAEEELSSQRDEVDLTREHIHELETGGGSPEATQVRNSSEEADEARGSQVANDLDEALSGRTKTECVPVPEFTCEAVHPTNTLPDPVMPSLKLQIRRLERELAEARSSQPGQSSDVLVLTNLLEDAKRAKERYEREYLDEHKASLNLKAQLEQIRIGKGSDR